MLESTSYVRATDDVLEGLKNSAEELSVAHGHQLGDWREVKLLLIAGCIKEGCTGNVVVGTSIMARVNPSWISLACPTTTE